MTRPTDWQPLSATDPVSGDSYTVAAEGKYYGDVAQEISDQVARLRRVASQDELVGKTADKLRSSAGDLAENMQKMHGRFAAAGSALTAWVPHLETAQRDTLRAYNDAHAALDSQRQYAPSPPPPAGSPPPTDAEAQAEVRRQNQYDSANAELTAAKKRFHDALDERDRQAKRIADQINGALHDGLKDSWWDSFSNWVHQHVGIIKMIVDILSWVATGLAFLTLFIPGLNLIAIGLMALTLAGHTLLAATGSGSWFDVALDVFALATFGVGKTLVGIGKTGELGTAMRGAELEGGAARAMVATERAAEKEVLTEASSNIFKRWLTSSGRQATRALKGFDDTTQALQAEAELTTRVRVLSEIDPETTLMERLSAGDEETASLLKYLENTSGRWLDDATVNGYRSLLSFGAHGSRLAFRSVFVVDVTNHLASHSDMLPFKPSLPGVDEFKESAGKWMTDTLHLPAG